MVIIVNVVISVVIIMFSVFCT